MWQYGDKKIIKLPYHKILQGIAYVYETENMCFI